MTDIGKQSVVVTLWILAIYCDRVDSNNTGTGIGVVGEILPFWEPDPRFKTIGPGIKRRYTASEHIKVRYDKGDRHEFNKILKTFSDSHPVEKDSPIEKDCIHKEEESLRRARVTPNYMSRRFTAIELKDVDDEKKPKENEEMRNIDEGFDEYTFDKDFVLSVYELSDQYKRLLSEYPNVNVTTEILGRTASYNDILLLKITENDKSGYFRTDNNKYAPETSEKKIVFIVHGLSAMGLGHLYSLTVERYLRQLLSFYLAYLDKFDIFLIPMANPDGYIKVKQTTYWNKNTSPQPACSGVALDRNFDVAWNSSRQISSCSHHYPGPRAFSEPESAAIGDIFHKYSHKIIAYLNMHAGQYDLSTFRGDAILYPRGFTDVQTSDDDKYIDLKGEVDETIKNANFKTLSVTVDTLYNWYGKVFGSSVDYAAEIYGIPYAMELVMQLYQDSIRLRNQRIRMQPGEEIEYYALTEVWGRVINVMLSHIWRKSSGIEQETNEM